MKMLSCLRNSNFFNKHKKTVRRSFVHFHPKITCDVKKRLPKKGDAKVIIFMTHGLFGNTQHSSARWMPS